ncbi:AfsR/SARP family transcriptional regulator [Streptomyces amakusaensis]|uniref:BTAD domain-containing putative transcriptional regulator n=1 Tax=Streptomyces amakusaensis TaxID=67271 RepID=A0ABW0AC18_9ACTN
MQLRALGPLVALNSDQKPISISPKCRQVLGLLVTHADHAVANGCFFEELWDGDPPRTAMTTLQTYVGQIRRVIAEATNLPLVDVANEILVTVGGGYMLFTKRITLDITEYERLDRAGRMAIRAGDNAEASALLRTALDLWRGPALVNVDGSRLLCAQIARMEECRLTTQEHRIYAELQLGGHHDLVAELFALTAAHPLNEKLHAHLMLALYRCGRRAEALSVLRGLRAQLVMELGLEPSPFLAALEQSMLSGDPSLELRGSGDRRGQAVAS